MFDGVLGLLKWVKIGMPVVAVFALVFGLLYVSNVHKDTVIRRQQSTIDHARIETRTRVFEQKVNDTNLTTKEIYETDDLDLSPGRHVLHL